MRIFLATDPVSYNFPYSVVMSFHNKLANITVTIKKII